MSKRFVQLVSPLVVAAAIAASLDGIAAQTQTLTAKVEAYMEAAVRINRFRGAVLLARDGRPVFSKAYGMASEELEVPNSTQTIFRLGSITKGFTAAAVMILQERGKLRAADPACTYLDECPAAWRPITIRHLLTHQSGIPSYSELPDYATLMRLPATHESTIARIRPLALEFAPGAQYRYSNSGYYLLGVIIERASGKPYGEFLQENIFSPLGMSSTAYDVQRRIVKNRATGYSLQGGLLGNALHIDMTVPGAAGGLASNVEDLLRWDQALYSEKILSRQSLAEMFTPVTPERAYGWGVRRRFDRAVTELDGSINGFASSLSRFTDDRVTVIVLANNRDVVTREIADALAAIAFDAPYEIPAGRRKITLDQNTLERYAGRYRFGAVGLSPNTVHTVSVAGGRLMRRVNDGAAVELYPESATTFFLDVPNITVSFEVDAQGRATAMILRRGTRETRAERIQ